LGKGVPPKKLVIGAAFYARVFKIDEGFPVDLYQPCTFQHTFRFSQAETILADSSGYFVHFDSTAFAPYAINRSSRLVATFDDERSIAEKTRYAVSKGLGGIMFWQLCDDKSKGGLLDVIHRNR
jgi:chitinase